MFEDYSKLQDFEPKNFHKFFMLGQHVGWMLPAHAALVTQLLPELFTPRSETLGFTPLADADYQSRSNAFAEGYRIISASDLSVRALADEMMAVSLTLDPTNRVAEIDRNNLIYGMAIYVVFANVFTRTEDKIALWISKRSATKKVRPNKLDCLAAGNISAGQQPDRAILDELSEEANISKSDIKSVSTKHVLNMNTTSAYGFPASIIAFCYDVEVTPNFRPSCNDGSVSDYFLFNAAELQNRLAHFDEWKPDSAGVTLDFAIRHGILKLPPEELATIQSYISRPLPFDRLQQV